jgi:hypothetical protein
MDDPENPKWLRPDGADERLANPTAMLINIFLPEADPQRPIIQAKGAKAHELQQRDPQFASQLLAIQTQMDDLHIITDINEGMMPPPDVLALNDQLETQKLKLVEQEVTTQFGSVEVFMNWWEAPDTTPSPTSQI